MFISDSLPQFCINIHRKFLMEEHVQSKLCKLDFNHTVLCCRARLLKIHQMATLRIGVLQ